MNMQGLANVNRENIRSSRDFRPDNWGLKNSLARYVRRRWPQLTVAAVSAEWGLSEGEARGVVYASASQPVIDKILKHKRGGWMLLLDIAAEVIGQDLADHLETERERHAERQRHATKLASLLRGVDPDPGRDGRDGGEDSLRHG